MLVGLVAGFFCRMPQSRKSSEPKGSFWQEFASLFNFDTLRKNRELFLLLLFIMVSSIGTQVSQPYLIVYLENFIGLTKTQFSLVGGVVLLGSALLAVPFGILADRMNRRLLIVLAVVLGTIGAILFSLARSLPLLMLTGLFFMGVPLAGTIASVAWMKDLLPEENRGKFLGIRMIFWIAVPMVIGPWIGSTLISSFGIPTVLNDQAGFIPVPIIFQVGAGIGLLSLIPLFFMRSNGKKVDG